MGKILVTRIACLGPAAHIFRETNHREKPRNLWGESPSEIYLCWNEKSAARPTTHAFIYEPVKYDYLWRQSTISERISRKLSYPTDF